MARNWRYLGLVIVLLAFVGHTNAVPSAAEVAALIAIKSQWSVNATWDPTLNPCNWTGIKCDPLGNHVVYLNVTMLGVKGDVPDAIRSLTFLEHFDGSNWDPQKLGNFPGWNAITGDLAPFASLTSLKSFNVSWNLGLQKGVGIPAVVFGLTNLTELRIDNCYLTGTLSPQIGNLKQLQFFYAGNNTMSGGLPKELGGLTSLRELTLWLSSWKSEIPVEFGKLVNLEYLNLRDSGLWGGLPSEMGALTRMKKLHLYNNILTGEIPSTWQSMSRLSELRLSNNYISGEIPAWIWAYNLSNLQLQDNRLTGPFASNLSASVKRLEVQCNFLTGPIVPVIPTGFDNKSFDVDDNCFTEKMKRVENKCKTNTLCNAYLDSIANGVCPPCPANQEVYNATLCTCKPFDPEKKSNVGPIVGGVVGGALGALAIMAIIFGILWKRKRDKAKQVDGRFDPALIADVSDPNWQAPPGVQRFKLSELSNATGGFDKAHEIGVGGFGKVFIGNFKDGRTLAIKRASGLVSSNQGLAEFRNEVLLLSRLHHRNLVRLEGFCDESGLQILVYEFVRQGNLHAHLFRPKGSGRYLNWYNRLEIAVGVANGLDYLHTFADPPVIHRDVKPSNILLDDNLSAKVADFGISRATDEFATHVSTKPAGTAGYFDPQYFIRRQLTTASDVYGYGVVLLELVTGQRAIDHGRTEEFNLVEWARPRYRSGGIEAIVDPKLGDTYPKDVFSDMAELAMECALFNKDDRPSMKAVLNILEPQLHNCQPPPPSEDISSWDSMDLASAPSHAPSQSSTGDFTGGSSITNASSSHPLVKQTRVEMTSTLLPR
ncbi:hypothetical protein KC19_6G123800 [Ceratodon purpureus]|uniref:Protein kinase domain-containing protein n=1 Tax=Ceratodon purpureus TaxID=3225 RepID=A0A8T0HHK0_CERPU|nr:hypothetical protein KC19_6G123800 [Ceratodon purpureus]